MPLELARTRTTLTREIEALEALLEREDSWRELRDFEARTGSRVPLRPGKEAEFALPQDLRDALKRNPLFLARASLLEALESLTGSEGETEDAAGLQAEFELHAPIVPPTPEERIAAALAALAARARALPPPDLTPAAPALETQKLQPSPQPARIPIYDDTSDDLRHIAFIDDEVAARLNASGIVRFSDIAHLTVDQVAMISVRFGLGSRISREQWVEQAAILANGGSTAYARQVQHAELGVPETPGPIPAPLPSAHVQDVAPSDLPTLPPYMREDLPPPFGEHLNAEAETAESADIPGTADLYEEPVRGAPPSLTPPPLPSQSARPAWQAEHHEHDAEAYHPAAETAQVRMVARWRERPRTRSSAGHSAQSSGRRWPNEDRSYSRNSPRWENVEEAAVEIVPVTPPFPGVGPVQEAARRLQFAAEMPESTLAGILKALRRR